MKNLARILTGVLLLILFTSQITTADITSVKIQSDNRDAILFKQFEFTQNGHVSVAISSASVTSNLSQPDPSRIGFFLVSQDNLFQFKRARHNSCELDSKFTSIIFTFQDLSPPPQSSFNKSYNVTYPNWYSLRFANCNPLSYVSMDVRIELYNTDIDGNTKDYLSAGLTKLPSLYYIFSLIYVCFVGFWIFVCYKNHQSIHWIHLLIGVLLVVKGLNLFCGAQVQHYLSVTGLHSYTWDVLFYIFQFFRVVLSYAVIVVTRTQKFLVLMGVIALQVLSTVLSVKGDGSPLYTDAAQYYKLSMCVNTICCFAIICQMIMCNHNYETDDDQDQVQAARNDFANFTPFIDDFHTVVVPYLLIDLILGIVVPCSYHWVSNGANEISSLGFFMVMLYMFMPFQKTNYLLVSPV